MKTVGILSIIYGVLGIIWAAVVSLLIRFQQALFANFPWPPEVYEFLDMPALLESVYGVIGTLIPFVFLGAALYVVSGILLLNGNKSARNLGYSAAVFNIVWYLVYMLSIQIEILPILNSLELFPKGLMNLIFIFGTLFNSIFYCGYAVFLIIFLKKGTIVKDTLQTGYNN